MITLGFLRQGSLQHATWPNNSGLADHPVSKTCSHLSSPSCCWTTGNTGAFYHSQLFTSAVGIHTQVVVFAQHVFLFSEPSPWFIHNLFMLRCVPLFLVSSEILLWRGDEFCQRFFLIEKTMWYLCLNLHMGCSAFTVLQVLNHPCNPGVKPAWSWWKLLLICCGIQFVSTSLREFEPLFIGEAGLYFCHVFIQFGITSLDLSQEFGSIFSPSVYGIVWVKTGINYFSHVW